MVQCLGVCWILAYVAGFPALLFCTVDGVTGIVLLVVNVGGCAANVGGLLLFFSLFIAMVILILATFIVFSWLTHLFIVFASVSHRFIIVLFVYYVLVLQVSIIIIWDNIILS